MFLDDYVELKLYARRLSMEMHDSKIAVGRGIVMRKTRQQ